MKKLVSLSALILIFYLSPVNASDDGFMDIVELRQLVNKLQGQIKELNSIIEQQKEEIKRLREINISQGITTDYTKKSIKDTNDIKTINKQFFGIYLGEPFSETIKRRTIGSKIMPEDADDPSVSWSIKPQSDLIEECKIKSYQDRVVSVSVHFKDSSFEN